MMKPRHLVLAVGAVVSSGLAFFGDKTPVGGTVEAAQPASRFAPAIPIEASLARASESGKEKPIILALASRDTLIGGAQAEKPAEGLFSSQSWTPPPPPPPKVAPMPPMAPPLPFVYIGKKFEGGIWEVYLARGDQIVIAHEHSEIEGTYRVDSISPPMLSLTYLPLKQTQMMPIGGTD